MRTKIGVRAIGLFLTAGTMMTCAMVQERFRASNQARLEEIMQERWRAVNQEKLEEIQAFEKGFGSEPTYVKVSKDVATAKAKANIVSAVYPAGRCDLMHCALVIESFERKGSSSFFPGSDLSDGEVFVKLDNVKYSNSGAEIVLPISAVESLLKSGGDRVREMDVTNEEIVVPRGPFIWFDLDANPKLKAVQTQAAMAQAKKERDERETKDMVEQARRSRCQQIAYNLPGGMVPRSRGDIGRVCSNGWRIGSSDWVKCRDEMDACWDILSP